MQQYYKYNGYLNQKKFARESSLSMSKACSRVVKTEREREREYVITMILIFSPHNVKQMSARRD